MVKQGDPAFRSLTTTNIQNATSNSVVSLIDLLVPVVNHMDDKAGNPLAGDQRPAYDAFLKQSSQKEVWMYQSCMSHGCGGTSNYFVGWVSYAIDASALRNRGMEWLSFKYDVTGELYYDTAQAYDYAAGREPWTNQWAYGGNGDGTFFYPGTPSAIGGQTDIPVASLRLKMLREGMEDFEYLKALSDAGEPTLAREIASALFPNPWTMPSVQDLFAARARMASKIVELKHRAGNVASSSGEPTSSSEPGVVSLPRPAVLRMRAGCSAGAGAEIVAALGLLTAVALRRRHRAR
jgi:uncharacterized protein (TIGR03382 family)